MIRPHIVKLIERGNIAPAEVRELRCNSWEWEAIVPALDNDAIAEHFEHCLKNCCQSRRRPAPSYDAAVCGYLGEEILKRLRSFIEKDQEH